MFDFKTATKEELQQEYKKMAKEMGDIRFFTKKELYYLPEILMDDESVIAFISGLMNRNTWLIVLTDRRIIFLNKGMFYGLKQSIIDLDKVNAVSATTGLIFGKIIVTDGATDRVISRVWKKAVKNFTNKIQEALEIRKLTRTGQILDSHHGPYEQLEKIAELKERGLLTEEEFQIEKKRILGYE